MIALELSQEQQQAVDAPFDACLALTGAAGTGKTTALVERIARARRLHPDASPLVLTSPQELVAVALEVLAANDRSVQLIDDVDAARLFASVCTPLFALQWDEIAEQRVDPEVPGLRMPERFLESAFRLMCRLRDANVAPETFLSRALAGATEFYAKPPNFADPALLYATKDAYRDSLSVTSQELDRQYRREIDLAKILGDLYERYVDLVASGGRMTGRDAVVAAHDQLRADGALAARLSSEYRFAFVDRAEEMTVAELHLLQAIFGEALSGVTLCGDCSSAISTRRRAHPESTFGIAASAIVLQAQHRSPPAVELACRVLTRAPTRTPADGIAADLQLYRAPAPREEATFVGDRVRSWLDEGTPPERIAILLRTVRSVALYEAALLDRNIPVAVVGDVNLFADRRALDALALLWNVCDPFRHEWLLRTLANPAIGLSDASLAALCSEPPDAQEALFVLQDEPAPTLRPSRWDPKRDLRLGWNVVRGEQDSALTAQARERVERFRTLRSGWIEAMHAEPFESFVRTVWREGLAGEGTPDSARARSQQLVLRRLLARLNAFRQQEPAATIEDALRHAELRMRSDLESCEDDAGNGFVRISSVEAAGGREFDRVVVADVRAGAFPRWYAPDAFLFSPRLGMIPKETTGDAAASRTAKFSYYTFRAKTRERYNMQERRAFVYALRRARKSVLVTASERPTKGVAAPEFLEELRGAHLPGAASF